MKTVPETTPRIVVCMVVTLLALGTVTWAQQAGNASLLYYQAFLLYEKPDDTMAQMITDFRKGTIGVNATIIEHIEKNRRVIDYVVAAANMPTCDWGYDYRQGADLALPNLPAVRRIAFLLSAEARLLAEQGDYATALDRCLTLRKMALQTCDRTLISYLVGIALNGLANGSLQGILGLVPDDAGQLNRLRSQLTHTQEKFAPLAYCLGQEADVCAQTMRIEKADVILKMVQECDGSSADPALARIQQADEAFFERNRTHWFSSTALVIDTLESSLPYSEMCAKLGELDKRLCAEAQDNPDATLTAISLPAVGRIYQLTVRQQTHLNAIQTAIDLYIAKAGTGRLPDALPADSPRDLFSGEPFEYERTDGGFILRCRAKEYPDEDKPHEYEFIVKP